MASSLMEKLIVCVQQYPVLYDLEHPDYKNIRKKDKIWDEIGIKLGEDGTILKTKWKNMRDCYIKHLKTQKTSTGQSAKPLNRYRTWKWAQQMEFFRPFMKFASTDSNVSRKRLIEDQPSVLSDNNEQPENSTDNSTIVSIEAADENTASQSNETALLQAKTPRKEKPNENTSGVDKVISYLEKCENKNNEPNYDDIDLLFLGLAKTVKTFYPRRQAMTKLKIANIVLEQEVQQREEEQLSQNTMRPISSTSAASTESSVDYEHYVNNPPHYSQTAEASTSTQNFSATKYYEQFPFSDGNYTDLSK